MSLPVASRPARSLALALSLALVAAVAACGGDGAAPSADAPAANVPADGGDVAGVAPETAAGDAAGSADQPAADLSALATDDVVLVDRTQMAGEPCHAMGNVVMGDCATQEDVDAVVATMGIAAPIVIDANQMAEAPCHVMGGTIMGACTADEAAAMVDEVRAGR